LGNIKYGANIKIHSVLTRILDNLFLSLLYTEIVRSFRRFVIHSFIAVWIGRQSRVAESASTVDDDFGSGAESRDP
jgi:hypothetical protein